jgi:hypothetical protein
MLQIAREKEIKKVVANVMKQNTIMKHIFKKRDFSLIDLGDTWRAELSLC